MNPESKGRMVHWGLTAGFLVLGASFLLNLWGHPALPHPVPPVDPQFTNTATVRMSAAELTRTGGDTSGLACSACHDASKPVKLTLDKNDAVILPEEHKDLVMLHGRNNRNNHCFNCHDQSHLEMLRTPDGRQLKIVDSTKHCAGCHGPTYRDWEAGIHGRTSGFWDRKRGAFVKQDCTSCHDPHSPAFPSIKPGPRPNRLHGAPDPAPAPAKADGKAH